MARPLFVSSSSSSSMPMMTLLFVVLSVLSIFSVTTFLCGTRKMKKLKAKIEESSSRRRRSCSSNKNKLIKKLNSSLSNRAISMVKMLSWRKVEAEEEQVEEEEEEEEEEDEHEMRCYSSDQDEEALWRKNILMGERCRPIDFSGNIDYDFEGNVFPQSSSHQNGHH